MPLPAELSFLIFALKPTVTKEGLILRWDIAKSCLPTLVAGVAVLDTPVLCQVPNWVQSRNKIFCTIAGAKILVIWPCAVIRENEWLANEREPIPCSAYNCAESLTLEIPNSIPIEAMNHFDLFPTDINKPLPCRTLIYPLNCIILWNDLWFMKSLILLTHDKSPAFICNNPTFRHHFYICERRLCALVHIE